MQVRVKIKRTSDENRRVAHISIVNGNGNSCHDSIFVDKLVGEGGVVEHRAHQATEGAFTVHSQEEAQSGQKELLGNISVVGWQHKLQGTFNTCNRKNSHEDRQQREEMKRKMRCTHCSGKSTYQQCRTA